MKADNKPFVHLHLHSDFSLLDGACRLNDLMGLAKKYGMQSVALTDHGNLFGIIQFYEAAVKNNIKPIIGCEVYVARENRKDRSGRSDNSHHLILLAENQTGYQNLVYLVSQGFLEGFYYRPRIDLGLLQDHHQGLIALSACLKGIVPYTILRYGYDQAMQEAGRLQEIMGKGNFFLELQDHRLEDQKRVNPEIVRLSRAMGIPLVATNDCHYLSPDDTEAHDVLLCIQTGKTVQETSRMKYDSDQFYFKSPEEMYTLFGDYPEALQNTVEIADRCRVGIQLKNPKLQLPNYDVPAGDTLESYFEKIVHIGFEERKPQLLKQDEVGKLRCPLSEYQTRLKYEVGVIEQMGLAGYFLIVWDFINYARQQKIPVGPGRGSAAGSLVSYCLHITDLDPLQYDLLFERFLNPDRISMPDIDCDFCMRRRSEVLEYVTGKYGRDKVCQIITFGAMMARQVTRDVGRALDISLPEVNRIAKMIPSNYKTLEEAIAAEPKIQEAQKDPQIHKLLEIAKKLDGFSRHSSVHAAGVVITPLPLIDLVPLYKSNKDEIMTQFQMTDLEKIGLLKMDFLALANLTIIDDALKQIEKQLGVVVDLDHVDLEDPATYKIFADGQTTGVFQFESSGMKDSLRKVKPTQFEDLIALNALYRPGPMGNIDDFARRKHGTSKITYVFPEEEEILKETYGIIVYQEQVMRLVNAIAGFSLAEADELRKAIGKKKKDLMQVQKERFIERCKARGIAETKAQSYFQMIETFGSYGFNKSHSTAYAYLAYQTAYLKAHYPVQYMAALLSNEIGSTDKVVQYINECKHMGIAIAPPDINKSEANFLAEGDKIRFGLGAIRNLGETAVKTILDQRARVGHFQTFTEFCMSMDLRQINKRIMESLIKAGCFDSLGYRRGRLFQSIDGIIEHCQRKQKAKETGQKSLFASMFSENGQDSQSSEFLADAPEWEEEKRLGYEKETIGFYISGHPLEHYLDVLPRIGSQSIADCSGEGISEEVSIGGIVIAPKLVKTKKEGKTMATFHLEDLTGIVEVVCFPTLYEKTSNYIASDNPVLVRGRLEVQEEGQSARILAMDIQPIEEIKERLVRKLQITAARERLNEQSADTLSRLAGQYPGNCGILIRIDQGTEGKLLIDSKVKVRPTTQLLSEIEQLYGKGSAQLIY